jgi:hypothetical protein
LKRNFLRFGIANFISDNGWILEDKKIETFTTLASIKSEINSVPLDLQQFGEIYWITIEVPNLVSIYNRTFLKVQELFANIGGFVSAITILCNIILYGYVNFAFTRHVRKNLEMFNAEYLKSKAHSK